MGFRLSPYLNRMVVPLENFDSRHAVAVADYCYYRDEMRACT